MKKAFEEFLISEGYKKFTSSGKPSTVYDYVKRIDKVCEWENLNWQGLANNIKSVLPEYTENGTKAELGAKSHNAAKCALICFERFVKINKI